MTQGTARRQAAADTLVLRLEAAISSAGPGVLHVIPSTEATLHAAGTWARDRLWQVVGLREDFPSSGGDGMALLTPSQYLAACGAAAAGAARRTAVVFTDQFVSSEHAALLVRDGVDDRFYPTLELIASARYGVAVRYWVGEGFLDAGTAAGAAETAALHALRRYYRSCDALGDMWRMRGRQFQRSPAGRIEAARHRLRLYQSIVMLAPEDAAPSAVRLTLLEALAALQQGLPRLAGP